MRPIAFLTALLLVASACGGETAGPDDPDPTTTSTTTPIGGSHDASPAIFAAALHQLVTVDNTFGGKGFTFAEILVLDHLDPSAGGTGDVGLDRALTDAERAAIEERLAEVASVKWISDADEWRTDDLRPVIEGSAIVGVGEAIIDGASALVPVSLWCGGVCGTWFTYRAELIDDVWQVTGIEGPIAIS